MTRKDFQTDYDDVTSHPSKLSVADNLTIVVSLVVHKKRNPATNCDMLTLQVVQQICNWKNK
jgi:hypothetical protein